LDGCKRAQEVGQIDPSVKKIPPRLGQKVISCSNSWPPPQIASPWIPHSATWSGSVPHACEGLIACDVRRSVTFWAVIQEDTKTGDRFDRFPTDESDTPVCVCGVVKKTQLRHIRGRQRLFDAIIEEDGAHVLSTMLVCRWFNSPWVEKAIVQGQQLVVYGKPKRSGAHIVISHPEFEVVEEDAEVSVHVKSHCSRSTARRRGYLRA
jgi:hypothetical protein